MAPEEYASVALARTKEMPTRIAFALFIAFAATVFTRSWTPAAWLAVVVALQFIDDRISLPLRRRTDSEPSAREKALFIASMGGCAILFSSISVFCWFAGGVGGKIFAILMAAGTVLAMAVHIGRARRLLVVGWAPHAAYLVGLPLASAFLNDREHMLEMLVLGLGGVLFLFHVLAAVRRIDQGAQALETAMVDLDAQRRAAERANAAKSEFLATISHEIRTPMNAVVAASDLLRRTQLTATQGEQVGMLANASEVLMGLLNDILDLSKIESGKVVVESKPFDLVEKLERGVQLWRPRAAEKDVAMSLDLSELPARIVTDPLRLQQILFNLLSNAVKFTESGEIHLHGGRDLAAGLLWFEVADTGCGMDEETTRRIFQNFEQANAGTARRYGGTGLGLAISRRLAELLGGSLTVFSRLGSGSVFRLEIPLVECEAPSRQTGRPDQGSEGGGLSGIEILLAEDHPVNQRIVRMMLEPLGCRLTVVDDGEQAVERASRQRFDVILMDMQMPLMDGLEATRRIYGRRGPNADSPIVALTANALAEHRVQWAEVGVTLFAAKPINVQVLVDVLLEALRRTEAHEQAVAVA